MANEQQFLCWTGPVIDTVGESKQPGENAGGRLQHRTPRLFHLLTGRWFLPVTSVARETQLLTRPAAPVKAP